MSQDKTFFHCELCAQFFVVAENEPQAAALQERAGWQMIDGLKCCSHCQANRRDCPECGSAACVNCMIFGESGWMCGKCRRYSQYPCAIKTGRRERPWQELAMGCRR